MDLPVGRFSTINIDSAATAQFQDLPTLPSKNPCSKRYNRVQTERKTPETLVRRRDRKTQRKHKEFGFLSWNRVRKKRISPVKRSEPRNEELSILPFVRVLGILISRCLARSCNTKNGGKGNVSVFDERDWERDS